MLRGPHCWLRDAGSKGVLRMTEFTEKAKRALGGAGEFANDVATGAVRSSKAATRFVVREVKEHPLRTLAIGAAVGAVVAAVIMLRNKRDDDE